MKNKNLLDLKSHRVYFSIKRFSWHFRHVAHFLARRFLKTNENKVEVDAQIRQAEQEFQGNITQLPTSICTKKSRERRKAVMGKLCG